MIEQNNAGENKQGQDPVGETIQNKNGAKTKQPKKKTAKPKVKAEAVTEIEPKEVSKENEQPDAALQTADAIYENPVGEKSNQSAVPVQIITKNRKKTIWISLLVVFCLVAGSFGIKFYFDYQKEQAAIKLAAMRAEEEERLSITLPKEFPTIEVLSQFKSDSLIQSYYGIHLISDPVMLDTSTLGEKTIVFTVTSSKYPDISKTFEVTVSVKDTTAPILEGVKDLSLTVGGSLDLLEAVSASDNFDGDLKDRLEIIGDYSFDKAGTYDLQVVVTDSSGNTATQDFTLTVNKKSVVVDSGSGTKSDGSTPSYVDTPANYSHPVVAAAMSYVGKGPMNCTILVYLALQKAGVIPYPTSATPYGKIDASYWIEAVYYDDPKYSDYANFCTWVAPENIQPGDEIYWSGHEAIYIGDGKAVHGGWNGGNVVVAGINISSGYPLGGWRCY